MNCPEDIGSDCEKCGMGNHDHITSRCKNETKCVNCGQNHLSKLTECEVWKKEKEIMKIKVTKNLTYLEARSLYEHQPETTFSKIVQSAQIAKPVTKSSATQVDVNDKIIAASTTVIEPRIKIKAVKPSNQPKPSTSTNSQTQSNKTDERSNKQTKPTACSQHSKSPRAKEKEKTVKITRVQEEPIKTLNKYNSLEQMEEDLPPNT